MRPDTIDLHGQFVNEAEEILETRIRSAKGQGETHLHVIVGKGNHSPGHVQKIKPKVEQICREEGLSYATEENEGRIYVDLRGGEAVMPPAHHVGAPGYGHAQGGYQPQQQPQYGGGGGYPGKPQQQMQAEGQGQEQDPITKCIKSCCTVM